MRGVTASTPPVLPIHQRTQVPAYAVVAISPATHMADTPSVAPTIELPTPPPTPSQRTSRSRERAGSIRPHRVSSQHALQAVRALVAAMAGISQGARSVPASQ